MLYGTRRALLGGQRLKTFDFDPALTALIPSMAKRAGTVFAGAPIVQGKWDGSGTPDVLSFSRGSQIDTHFYDNFDPYQGGGVVGWTPEHSAADRGAADGYLWEAQNNPQYSLRYEYDNGAFRLHIGDQHVSANHTVVAGTTIYIAWGFDTNNKLDGTNYAYLSVGDAQTFGITSQPTAAASDGLIRVGNWIGIGSCADGIIEGLTFVREIPWTGTYGTDMGQGDIVAAHAAGADVCLSIGSRGVTACAPTDATPGALTTGTGEMWSHPFSSVLNKHAWLEDRFYGGGAYALAFDGSSTWINCGSAAALDDLGAGGNQFTVEAWVRLDSATSTHTIAHKGNALTGGWSFYLNNGVLYGYVDLVGTNVQAFAGSGLGDGKWHHCVFHYNDATKTGRCAVDGVWGSANVGAGVYVADAAFNLEIGRLTNLSSYLEGAIGWLRLSDNDRHTAGTDFVPPRAKPANDGNTPEKWGLADGSGATAVADVTSPGNDGTIANGTWEEQWDQEGTPVVPYSVELTGASGSYIGCGSAADIDNLPDFAVAGKGVITAEVWFRTTDMGGGILCKTSNSSIGWFLTVDGGIVGIRIKYATTDSIASSTADFNDGHWHHAAFTYDETGDRKVRLWVDGVLRDTGNASVGNYVPDDVRNCTIGAYSAGTLNNLRGGLGWARISDTILYTDTFVPPSRLNPPAVGASLRQFNFRDGAGTTLTDAAGIANATIANGTWNTTPDMAVDAPGQPIYGVGGYVLGVDAANEGITQIETGLSAGDDRVARVPLQYERDRQAWPRILIYDEIGAANITTFDGPRLVDLHTGGNVSATLINANGNFPQSLVGGTVYNITAGESATITAVSGDKTTITGVLSGAETWDTNDVYMIVPPNEDSWVWCEETAYELPGACTSISTKVINLNDEGAIYHHQVEQLDNLWDDPGFELGDAPTNVGTPTTSAQDNTEIHSGAQAWKVVTDAIGEGIKRAITTTSGKFYHVSAWIFADTADTVDMEGPTLQDGNTTEVTTGSNDVWERLEFVFRATAVSTDLQFTSNAAVQTFYVDDVAVYELDDISITATPASQANSAETTGLRIDGLDDCQQTMTNQKSRKGIIKWKWTPRHDDADWVKFGNTPAYIAWFSAPVSNYILVRLTAANTMEMEVEDGAATNNTWNTGGGVIVAGTTYDMRLEYNGTVARLYVDNVLRITVTPAGGFDFGADLLQTAYWGSEPTPSLEGDATFAAP